MADKIIGAAGLVGSLILLAVSARDMGIMEGKARANLDMWENPPGMAYCYVKKTGEKRCVPYAKPTMDISPLERARIRAFRRKAI